MKRYIRHPGVRRPEKSPILSESLAEQPQPVHDVPWKAIYFVLPQGRSQWLVSSILLLTDASGVLKFDSTLRKVAIVLEELGLTYESVYLDFITKEHKGPEFLKLNPNGRIPAIIDHYNNDFVLWWAFVVVHGRW